MEVPYPWTTREPLRYDFNAMEKRAALAVLTARSAAPLGRAIHFANVNSRKPVWWLDLPSDEVFDLTPPHIDLVLADTDARVHHLRVPKEWLIENREMLAVREDKNVVSIELSALPDQRFRDVRPRSGRLDFGSFLVN
jgi:hypothetical protein